MLFIAAQRTLLYTDWGAYVPVEGELTNTFPFVVSVDEQGSFAPDILFHVFANLQLLNTVKTHPA